MYLDNSDATLAPDDLNSNEPHFITWCLNIQEAFTTKLELISRSVEYGDYLGALQEPIIVIRSIDLLPTKHYSYFKIVHPRTSKNFRKHVHTIIKEGIIPALSTVSQIDSHSYPSCLHRWHKFVYNTLEMRLLYDDHTYNRPVVISCHDEHINLTFYPNRAASPVIIEEQGHRFMSSKDQQPIEDVPHTLFLDYDSRKCWQLPDEFWATVDEGYRPVLEPYCSDIDSIYTNPI
jgi:hypothetical protein